MPERRGHVLACSVVALALSGCAASAPTPEPSSRFAEGHVTVQWIEREVRVHTLDRMFEETGSDEVIANMGGTREHLFEAGVVVENGDGHALEPDKDAWSDDVHLAKIDGALGNAMTHNEVTWCGESVDGKEFVRAYLTEHEDSFDAQEEYTESVIDYVDCGTGRP